MTFADCRETPASTARHRESERRTDTSMRQPLYRQYPQNILYAVPIKLDLVFSVCLGSTPRAGMIAPRCPIHRVRSSHEWVNAESPVPRKNLPRL